MSVCTLCVAEQIVRFKYSVLISRFPRSSKSPSHSEFLGLILFFLSKQCITFHTTYFSEWNLRIQASFLRKLRRTKLENIVRVHDPEL
jgi:hypothetical protein